MFKRGARWAILAVSLGLGLAIASTSGVPEPAHAWCFESQIEGGSGLLSYGQEDHRGQTCDGDGIYSGRVRDHPTIADGQCAKIRMRNWGSSSWWTQQSACTSTWKNYAVYGAAGQSSPYDIKLCKGSTSICSIGSLIGI